MSDILPVTHPYPVTMNHIRNAIAWKTRYSAQEWAYLCGLREDYRTLTRVLPGKHVPFRNWMSRRRESLMEELLSLQHCGKFAGDLTFQVNTMEKYLINTARRPYRLMDAQVFREHFRKLTIQQLGVLTPEPSVINCLLVLEMMSTFWHEDVEFYIYVPSEVLSGCKDSRHGHKAVITPFFVFRRFGNGLAFVAERLLNAKAHEMVVEKLSK